MALPESYREQDGCWNCAYVAWRDAGSADPADDARVCTLDPDSAGDEVFESGICDEWAIDPRCGKENGDE